MKKRSKHGDDDGSSTGATAIIEGADAGGTASGRNSVKQASSPELELVKIKYMVGLVHLELR